MPGRLRLPPLLVAEPAEEALEEWSSDVVVALYCVLAYKDAVPSCWIRSAIQAMLVQLYRHHFGNPDISPLGYIFSCTGFTSATPKSALQGFIFIIST